MHEATKATEGIISILICSRGRRGALENLVGSVRSMDTMHLFEIVVVEETDNPSPIHDVVYVPHLLENRGIPYARNMALAHATGEIIVFLDDDCRIDNDWLDNLLEPFNDESVVGVQGGVTVPQSSNAIGWAESLLGFPGGGVGRIFQAKGMARETSEISTLNCAYRKWVMDKVGGFDERLKLGGEDYLLAKKACGEYGKCLFVPSAVVEHATRGNLVKVFLWFYRRGRAEIALSQTGWHRKKFILYWVKASLLLKILVLLLLCWAFSLILLGMSVGFLGYYLSKLVTYYSSYKRCGAFISSLIILPVVKIVMDIGIDCGRLRGLIVRS